MDQQTHIQPGPGPAPEQIETVHLSDYYRILLKHRAVIIASLLITVTLTALFTFLMEPVYRATATLIIDKEKSTSPLTGARVDYESYVSQSLTFNTHFKLIKSLPVIDRIINTLGLDREDEDQALEVNPVKAVIAQSGWSRPGGASTPW
jgi:uncharacterized protein involved in exopolysaccharide biosynthesis